MSEAVTLTAADKAAAAKLVAEVGQRVRGTDATAQSQAKYIAKNRAISMGVGRELLQLFIDEVCQAIDKGFEARREALPKPVLSQAPVAANGKPVAS